MAALTTIRYPTGFPNLFPKPEPFRVVREFGKNKIPESSRFRAFREVSGIGEPLPRFPSGSKKKEPLHTQSANDRKDSHVHQHTPEAGRAHLDLR